MNKFVIPVIALILITSASAVEVGVVAEFPNGAIFKKCVSVDERANAFEVLEKSGLKTTWTYDKRFGHGLCSILDIGCPPSECYCSPNYWNFFIKHKNQKSWKNSQVSFDGGPSCNDHYCAKNGDLLGFTYNKYGEKPDEFSFYGVCPKPTMTTLESPSIIGQVINSPERTAGTIVGLIVLILLIAYFVHKPWDYI